MEMLQFDFIQRAFLAGGAISLITPILGLLLILRSQSLLSDTLAHISLSGVALGMLIGVNPTWTTILVVVAASLMIEYLRTIYSSFSEVSVALMMSTGMAIALVLSSFTSNSQNFRIEQFLFGSILLVSADDVRLMYFLAGGIMVLYLLFRRPLYIISFDEETAFTTGLPVRLISVVFSVVTGAAISVMLPTVGSLLVSALIIIPSATAIKVARSFFQAILIAFIINVVGIFAGISMSYYYDTPPGASITLAFMAIFILVSLANRLWIQLKRRI